MFAKALPDGPDESGGLSMANTRTPAPTTLYALGQRSRLLVAGTGNKVEDFGVGFYTKYGDGGVDVSPIADLTKTEVFALAAHLGVIESIQKAPPPTAFGETTEPTKISLGPLTLSWNGPWPGRRNMQGCHLKHARRQGKA